MKKFFLLAILFFSSCLAFADIELVPAQNSKPQQFVQIELARSPNRGFERNQTFFSAEYNFDFTPFFGFAGIQTDENLLDIVLRSEWAPFVFQCDKGEWRFGGVFTYHFQKDSDYFKEHDIIFESSVHFKTKDNFRFTARSGYSWRLTYFPAIENFHIFDGDITIINEFDKIWRCGIELFAAVGSYSNFRYPLFFCPQLEIGLAYNFKKPIRIAAQIDWGTTDFLSSVMYINYILFKFNVRITF